MSTESAGAFFFWKIVQIEPVRETFDLSPVVPASSLLTTLFSRPSASRCGHVFFPALIANIIFRRRKIVLRMLPGRMVDWLRPMLVIFVCRDHCQSVKLLRLKHNSLGFAKSWFEEHITKDTPQSGLLPAVHFSVSSIILLRFCYMPSLCGSRSTQVQKPAIGRGMVACVHLGSSMDGIFRIAA